MGKGLLDILYELLTSPSKALLEVSKGKPLGRSILTAVFIAIVLAFSFLPNPPELIELIFDRERGSFNLALAVFLWVIIFLAALFIEGGIFHVIARLLRGQGSYPGMVCGLCFACFPFVLFAPLAFMRALLGTSGPVFYSIAYPIPFFWVFYLAVKTTRINYNFSSRRAIAVYFIPGILLIVFPLLVITVLIPL
ncbi:Yip1 family protein [Chloroflexota bacterium]